MKEKIKFDDLSLPLKISIVTSYIIGTIYIAAFIIGFIAAMVRL